MRLTLAAGLLAAFASQGVAQSAPWTRAVAMGGADFALSRGYAAVEWNPANLFIDDSVAFSFGSEIHAGRVLVTGAGLSQLADIATAKGAGDPALLNDIPATGLRIDAWSEGLTASRASETLEIPDPSDRADVPTMAFTYKNGGIVMRQQTIATATVSKELLDLAVTGFNPERINEYAAAGTEMRSFTLTSITFAMGKLFTDRIAGGFGVRYLNGRKLVTGRVFEPEVDIDNEVLTASAASVESRGGHGFAIDLGGTYIIRENLYASLSLQNVFQRMVWSDDLWVAQSELDQDDLGSTDLRDIIERFRADRLVIDGTSLEAYAAAATLFEGSFMPRSARIGVGYRSDWGTELQLTGMTSFGAGSLVPPRPDRLAFGAEHTLAIMRLRGGLAFEEGGSRQITFGFGLHFAALQIDLAGGWTTGSNASTPIRGLTGALGIGFVFLGDRIR